MERMQEDEFSKMTFTDNPATCRHHFVKLYDLSSHSDYGCVKCGFCTLTPEKYEVRRQ